MTLITTCTNCHQPLSIPLPDCTDEQEAQTISQSVLCQPCGLAAANGQPANSSPPVNHGDVQLKGSANGNQRTAMASVGALVET